MSPEDVLRTAVCVVLLGFGAFAVGHSWQVWQSRTRATSGSPPAPGSRAADWSVALIAAGILALVGALVFRHSVERDGHLLGYGLYTLRLSPGYEVADVTDLELAEPGKALAVFRKVPGGSELDAARREQLATGERRHIEAVLEQTTVERDRATRDELAARLQTNDLVSRLDDNRLRLRADLQQAQARVSVGRKQQATTDALLKRAMVSEVEGATRKGDVRVLEAEVRKIEGELENLEKQRARAEQLLAEMEAVGKLQSETRKRETQQLQARMAQAEKLEAEMVITSDTETGLTRSLPGRELARTVPIPAPFSGHIAYRHPSPSTAFGNQPLLVLSPPDGLRVRVRLPEREIAALRQEQRVLLEVADSAGALERRFSGRLGKVRSIPEEPEYSIAEFIADPPPDAVRDLVQGSFVRARLKWTPPVWALPLFRFGMALIFSGVVGRFWFLRRQAIPVPTRA